MIGLVSLVLPQPEPASLVIAWASIAAIAWIERHPEHDSLTALLCKPGVLLGWVTLIIAIEVLRYEPSWSNTLRWAMMLAIAWNRHIRWPYGGWLLLIFAILAPKVHSRGQLINSLKIPQPVIGLANWIRAEGVQGPILADIDPGLDYLQVLTRQPVWVDKKQGAAVMWEPSFHSQWMSRYRDVAQLNGTAEFLAYARQHHIQYIVTRIHHLNP